jgi:hypothetical protein
MSHQSNTSFGTTEDDLTSCGSLSPLRSPLKARKKAITRSNSASVPDYIVSAIVQIVANLSNPEAVTLHQAIGNNKVFSGIDPKRIRNRYNRVLKLRKEKPIEFLDLCCYYSVVPSIEVNEKQLQVPSVQQAPPASSISVSASSPTITKTSITKKENKKKMAHLFKTAVDGKTFFACSYLSEFTLLTYSLSFVLYIES